jgi:PhnB protein
MTTTRTTGTPATSQAQIRAVLDEWAAALRAKNAEGVVRHHAPEFLLFSLAPPLVSADTDAKGLQAWFDTWQGPLAYELRDLTITADDAIAWCYGLTRLGGTKTDGQKNELWFRQTLCLRRDADTWKIVHQHQSVPFYRDGSYKAAVDLRP